MRDSTSPRLLTLLGVVLLAPHLYALITDETEAEEFMKELDIRYSHECNLEMLARWDYITDVLDPDKEEAANEAAVRYMTFKGEAAVNSSQFEYGGFSDIELYRRFRFLSKKGPGALSVEDLTEYENLQANMETIYSTATICDYHDPSKCDLTLEPDIEAILASSEDWDELQYVWEQWRVVTGPLMRDDFVRFVELSNKAATLDGFEDTGAYWLSGYTVDQREADAFTDGLSLDQQQFRSMVDTVWQEVSIALYKRVHAYVRMRLQEVYPGRIDPKGPIPAHILGNMWAQDWSNIAQHVMPFPEMPTFDVTDSMVENGWNIQTMFWSAEDFFQSIGLFPMTQTFWDLSVINQTAWGKTIVCHASAEDFCLGPEGDDYRIKMCTEVNMVDLITVHHEMGHIEYFMSYKNQPHVFRDSANPGFHEAIGDLIALSVATPKHLDEVLGLTPTRRAASSPAGDPRYTDDQKRDLNFLMKMALEKIAFLPFGFLIDQYRWGVFDGSISSEELNAGWWNLRESLQGVTPPGGDRGEEFFDPGAKYHVPANVPYIRYFVSFIVQFQFHSRLCEAAGHTGPLYTCDIYNNPNAGSILRSALEKGFSEPWPNVLTELGGSPNMDPRPIIEYFEPLILFLDQELLAAGQCVGWGDECLMLRSNDDTESKDELEAITKPTEPATDGGTEVQQTSESTDSVTDEPVTETESPVPSTSESTDGVTDEPVTETESPAPSSSESTDGVTDEPVTETESPVTEVSESTTEEGESTSEQPTSTEEPRNDEEAAWLDMVYMDGNMTLLVQEATLLDWAYNTDVTDANAAAKDEAWLMVNQEYSKWHKDVIEFYNYQDFTSDALRRQFELQKNRGTAALGEEEFLELSRITSEMTGNYTNRVCPKKGDCPENGGYSIDELEGIMATERDYDTLKYYWTNWREESGKNMKENYERSVILMNLAASRNGFSDAGAMWLDPYTDDSYTADGFKCEMEELWNKTRPLYERLHAYVLHKLKDVYEKNIDKDEKFIPAHVLGNMWAQSWENIYDIVKPNEVSVPDITEDLETNINDVKDMFALSENFFTSLGLYEMTEDFWNNSMYEQPTDDREVICHASAWDFFDTENMPEEGRFRIKMCADKTQEDFIVIHHEMGHTQYQMSYSFPTEERPLVFRDGANPGFHEAIGDTIALSVKTPKHLMMISDFLNNGNMSDIYEPGFFLEEDEMNDADNLTEEETVSILMKTALAKIPFLPFAYIVDQWRWEVFANNNSKDVDYNRQWWSKRLDIQGIAPPVDRFPSSDFDPGSKFHVATNIPYIRYFVAHMLQFSFHQRLCSIAFGKEQEIFICDIYNQTEAGTELKKMLQKGASVPWKDQLEDFLGDGGKMNADDLLAYFKPLDEYLKKYLAENNIKPGWDLDQVDQYMLTEPKYIPATVPIVVGVVLAVMVLVVLVAYFVGQSKQKKKAKAAKKAAQSASEVIEMSGEEGTSKNL